LAIFNDEQQTTNRSLTSNNLVRPYSPGPTPE